MAKNDDVSRRRRAIHLALGEYLAGDDLLHALCIWQQHYARLPRFALTDYVRRIGAETALAGSKAAVQLSLTRALIREDRDLGADPLAAMQAYLSKRGDAAAPSGDNAKDSAPAPSKSDSVEVFERLLGDFLSRIGSRDTGTENVIRRELTARARDIRLNGNGIDSLTGWLARDGTPLQVNLSPDQLQQFLHTAYVSACDHFGPVIADRFLAESLEDVEKLQAGRRFSPRELL